MAIADHSSDRTLSPLPPNARQYSFLKLYSPLFWLENIRSSVYTLVNKQLGPSSAPSMSLLNLFGEFISIIEFFRSENLHSHPHVLFLVNTISC